MCVVFLNKLKPDGGEFCSLPCLQFSPANSLKSQPSMSGAYSLGGLHRWHANSKQDWDL